MKTILQVLLTLVLVANNSHCEVTEDPPIEPSWFLEEKLVEYGGSNETTLEGFLVYPKIAAELTKAVPAVIVFHTFEGRTDFEESKARELAMFGYVALAADVFGKGVAGNDTNENLRIEGDLLNERTTTLHRRMLAAWELVKGLSFVDDQKIACIGYSLGGLSCLDLARFNVGLSAAVSFHGILDSYPENDNTTSTSTSIQAHYGIDDANADLINFYVFMEEMKARKADWQFTFYSDAVGGFTIPGVEKLGLPNTAYNEKADRRSNEAMHTLLSEKLW